MKHFDLFSGFGGFTIASEQYGFETIGFSEIDKYANAVLKYHYPNIKNYGDITKINAEDLPDFDLLTFGSPCQDLSIAKKDRKGLDGERSGLFYKAVEILKVKKPKYFIMENVASMSKENRDKISEVLGVQPVLINGNLVSAQNRKRLFWTNISNVTQPSDRGILLKDVLEDNFKPTEIKSKTIRTSGLGSGINDKHNWQEIKSYCLPATYYKENVESLIQRKKTGLMVRIGQIGKGGQGDRIYSPDGKGVSLSANGGGRGAKTGLYMVKAVAQRGRNLVDGKRKDILRAKTEQRMEIGGDKANTITSVFKDSMVLENSVIRKLTPVECCRLMTITDNWLDYGMNEKGEKIEISNSQKYKMAGNGVIVEVVKHIFECLKNPPTKETL